VATPRLEAQYVVVVQSGTTSDRAAGLPLVDVSPLLDANANAVSCAEVGRAIDGACRDTGFFLVTGHGIDRTLRDELERLSREFFALPDETKAAIAMPRGGIARRGWFPVGGELTSGRPDRKEGVYFGTELPATDPRVIGRTPLHGPNLFPAEPAGLAPAVLQWVEQVRAGSGRAERHRPRPRSGA
jgi:isopenicillin N synthase-like dioxygenase